MSCLTVKLGAFPEIQTEGRRAAPGLLFVRVRRAESAPSHRHPVRGIAFGTEVKLPLFEDSTASYTENTKDFRETARNNNTNVAVLHNVRSIRNILYFYRRGMNNLKMKSGKSIHSHTTASEEENT